MNKNRHSFHTGKKFFLKRMGGEFGGEKRGKSIPDINLSEQYPAMEQNDKLIINVRALNHTIRSLYEGKESQKRILIILRELGDITQKDLTERLGIQPGSASEVIGKLEHAGLIRRVPSQVDRRTADISLTESGRAKAQEAFEQRQSRHCEMFSCLSEEEKSTLLMLMEKLNEDWDSRYRGISRRF